MITPLKIKSIKRSEPADVYDIQVQKNHNFIANGMVVHNCIIFQEQLMSLCNIVAGFPKSECDKVRKNILKRQGGNPEESMKKAKAMKDAFVVGAVKNGVGESVASKLWDDILFFAGYGFNLTCSYDTEVNTYTKEGNFLATKQIQHIGPSEFVKSRDEATGKEIFVEVVQRHDHGVQDLYEVTLDSGETVKCSLDHKFRTTDGLMLPLSQIVETGRSIVTVGSLTDTRDLTSGTQPRASVFQKITESRGSSAKSAASLRDRWESISALLTA